MWNIDSTTIYKMARPCITVKPPWENLLSTLVLSERTRVQHCETRSVRREVSALHDQSINRAYG